jgi:putative DNA primase/helicase
VKYRLRGFGGIAIIPKIRGQLTIWLREEFLRLNRIELAAWAKKKEKGEPPTDKRKQNEPPKVRPVTVTVANNVLQALRGSCLVSGLVDAPAWINGAAGPDPAKLLPLRNGILDLEVAAEGRLDCLLPLSPSFFTQITAPFDFDPEAARPVEWLRFLGELWSGDQESIDTLQEWFGYTMTTDTRQQKILLLLGPKRSGKGTIARVWRVLIGPNNVVRPTLGSLATNFGLSPLLVKSVAVISDARITGRSDEVIVVERLLSISGEDAQTIDRKYRESHTVKLPTRFVILSNELPRLKDNSGALTGRLILLRLNRSWFGREDQNLFDRLRCELPGILLWAIEGWRRLQARGRFIQPASGVELVEDMENLSSPVGAFIRECCEVGFGFRSSVDVLYREWRIWCESHGRKEPGTEETFGRDLRAVVPELKRSRPRNEEGKRYYAYSGIRLRNLDAPEPENNPPPPGPRDQPLYAREENNQSKRDGDAISGRQDHPDQPRPRRRYSNDDRPYERR